MSEPTKPTVAPEEIAAWPRGGTHMAWPRGQELAGDPVCGAALFLDRSDVLTEVVYMIPQVTCERCLIEWIRFSMNEGSLWPVSDPHREYYDEQVLQAGRQIGRVSLATDHPEIYNKLVIEAMRPPEPQGLLAVVRDIRGVHWSRWDVSVGGHPWVKIESLVRVSSDVNAERWLDIDAVSVVWPGLPQEQEKSS